MSFLRRAMRAWAAIGLATVVACAGDQAPAPVPPPAPKPPQERPIPEGAPVQERPEVVQTGVPCELEIAFALPSREVRSPLAVPDSPALKHTREVLERVVREHGRDPGNPWAVSHAMLALGTDITLDNGAPAVDWLFEHYAEVQTVNGEVGLAFPSMRGTIRIEPHRDLLLKALTEGGVLPDRQVRVGGEPHAVVELYRRSMCAFRFKGSALTGDELNDSPWSLQAFTQWAPPHHAWVADGGVAMNLDALTTEIVDKLSAQTEFLRQAAASGRPVQKRKQGIFQYTCGGAHLIQGAVWAVGRGFGAPEDRARVAREVSTYLARLDIENGAVDGALARAPEYADLLLVQRMKYLGHLVETAHKAAALGVWSPTDAERAELDRAVAELVTTVGEIERRGFFDDLEGIRARREQTYLDYIGDSAHALRGLDLHVGRGTVRY